MHSTRAAFLAGMVVLCLSSPAFSVELDQMSSEDLRLLYFDATQGYLAPHVARCFFNSLELHRELWGWEPATKSSFPP